MFPDGVGGWPDPTNTSRDLRTHGERRASPGLRPTCSGRRARRSWTRRACRPEPTAAAGPKFPIPDFGKIAQPAVHHLATEWGEYAEEHSATPGHHLLRAARLSRDPDRYIARFGRAAYEVMLGDSFWHIYRMIGKLSSRIYLLSRADSHR